MTRDLPPANNLTIEQKWQLVHGAEQLRWQEEKNREEHGRFLDNTITPKQASSVWVSLKSHETSLSAPGHICVGAGADAHKSSQSDISLENDIAKCSKIIFNSTIISYRVREVIRLNGTVTQIVSPLNSPHLLTRKLICEVLLSIIYISNDALSLLFLALENLGRSNEVPPMNDPNDKRNVPGYYDYWFRSLERAVLGRGKMGSLVGAIAAPTSSVVVPATVSAKPAPSAPASLLATAIGEKPPTSGAVPLGVPGRDRGRAAPRGAARGLPVRGVSIFGAAGKRGREEEAADDALSKRLKSTTTETTGTVKPPVTLRRPPPPS
ncbi:hypothetical protein M405DRAFT_858908 [Rhizopogon salebrosus TDB-379]|nr:hypothetical protein M405DRAFT_858908 [Rhizopogon salebrosus TDB-379]